MQRPMLPTIRNALTDCDRVLAVLVMALKVMLTYVSLLSRFAYLGGER